MGRTIRLGNGPGVRRENHAMADDPYRDDSIWDTWAKSVIMIRVADGREVRAGSAPLPWIGATHVITAWNPGRTRSRDENLVANERLREELEAKGLEHRRAVGSSPDGSWSEEGFAVTGLSRAEATQLGREFGQLAIYEISGSTVVIIDCSDGRVLRTNMGT